MKQFEKFDPGLFNTIRNLDERAIVLGELGELVSKRVVPGQYEIKIYTLFDFYVEVWVNIKELEVEKIYALESDNDWDGYLKSVRLADYF